MIHDKKVPLCLPMVHARTVFWDSASWDTEKGMDSRAKYLGMATMADTGCRNSNLTGPVKEKGKVLHDHGVLCSSLEVEVEVGEGEAGKGGQKIDLLHAGPGLQACLARPEVHADGYAKVRNLELTFLTTKTTTDDTATLPPKAFIGRTTDLEARLLVDWLEWLRHNVGQQTTDYVLSRYSPEVGGQRRLMQRSDLATIIKHTAEAMGMDPKVFSTSSGRRCFTTHCIANGMPMDEMNQRAGWSYTSKVPNISYNSTVQNQGIMALGEKTSSWPMSSVWPRVPRPSPPPP
jgi:hypothetical protein